LPRLAKWRGLAAEHELLGVALDLFLYFQLLDKRKEDFRTRWQAVQLS
jgi:hypothetical protein